MDTERNTQLIHDYADVVWNKGQVDRLGEFLHEEVRMYGLGGEPPVAGLERLKRETEQWRALYSEASMTVDRVVAEGDRVAWQWQLLGTIADVRMLMPHVQRLADEVPQFKQISVHGMSISSFQDGRIIEEVTQSDMAEFLKQIGFPAPRMPQDGSPA
ncbi:ester cyclase [Streptomyces sp. NBC_00212]|uniref:ester cyclase n=1 Tax=Streptomyces sp. NBC_00212 TaxID=2975684 RepID=UPI002F90DE08